MKWILEHLQLIILVGGAIAYWLNQRRREKEGLPADYDEDGVPENKPVRTDLDPSTMEADEAERTRRVQEEIRRKIAERRGQALPPPVPAAAESPQRLPIPARREVAPPPVFKDPVAEMLKELQRRLAPEAVPAPAVPSRPEPEPIDRDMLERQRSLEQRLRELESEKRTTQAKAAQLANPLSAESAAGRAASVAGQTGAPWLAELRNPAAARRAIVLKEVLGTPVGLR